MASDPSPQSAASFLTAEDAEDIAAAERSKANSAGSMTHEEFMAVLEAEDVATP